LHRKVFAGDFVGRVKKFSELFESDLLEALKPENCVAARTSYGGPAFSENAKQLTQGEKILQEQKKVIATLFKHV